MESGFTPEFIASVLGILLSLGFSYIPYVKEWFELLKKEQKQMTIGLLLVAVAVGSFTLACAGLYTDLLCTRDGAIEAAKVLVAALVANQATYLITKR